MSRLLSILVLASCTCCAGLAYAADSTAAGTPLADTTATQAREIRVVGSQWLGMRADPFLASASIPTAVIERFAPPTISDVLQVVPGLHVRQYGGLGGLRTVSVRGAGAAQTLVLFDGIRMSSVQNGTVDLGLIPTSLVGSVDIIRGGAAALYGANAISGVVHMHARTYRRAQAWCTIGGGSFDEVDLRTGGSTTVGSVQLTGSVDVLRLQGTYPYSIRHHGEAYTINRANADVDNVNGMIHARGKSWSAFSLLRSAERGIPGPLVDGVLSPSRSRLRDVDGMVGFSATVGRWGAWTVSTSNALRVWDQWFFDPDATVMGPQGINEGYVQRDAMTSVQAQLTTDQHNVTARVEAGFADLRGRMLQPDVGSLVIRRSIAAAADWQWQPAALSTVSMRAALRADAISDMGTAVSPMLALHWTPITDASIRASYSYDFRAPSFNELYYLNYGTSTLRPERSHTINVGAQVAITEVVQADVDVFTMQTRDQILAVPTSAVAVSARNIGRTTSMGIECGLRATLFDDALMAYWSYTLQDVRDRSGRMGIDGTLLPYVPQEMIGMGATYTLGDLGGGLQWTYVSHQFAQSGEPWLAMLPRYHVLTANLDLHSRLRSLGVDIRMQANNLLDNRYTVIQGFPMPGRSFRVLATLRWEAS